MTYIPLSGAGFGTDVVLPAVVRVLMQRIIDESLAFAVHLYSLRGDDAEKEAALRLYMQSRLNTTNLIARPLFGIVRGVLEGSIPGIITAAKRQATK